MEKSLLKLLLPAFATVTIHTGLRLLRSESQEIEEEMEGYEGEFQILGLS